jgi:hypothetical protein
METAYGARGGTWGDAGGMTTNDKALTRTARMIAQHGRSVELCASCP